MRTYTLKEAARLCSYRRVNTFRERFLATDDDYARLVVGFDSHGRLMLHADHVDEIARALREERANRGNWRRRNLGNYALPGRPKKGLRGAGLAAGAAESRGVAWRPVVAAMFRRLAQVEPVVAVDVLEHGLHVFGDQTSPRTIASALEPTDLLDLLQDDHPVVRERATALLGTVANGARRV